MEKFKNISTADLKATYDFGMHLINNYEDIKKAGHGSVEGENEVNEYAALLFQIFEELKRRLNDLK